MDPITIVLFIVLFMLSGFFSGTEIALMSLSNHKVESLYKSKRLFSGFLKKIRQNTDRLLITILIGNNLVNTYVATLAAQIAIGIAEKSSMPQAQAVGIATGIITFLLLMFGEIIPKSIATKNAESISLFVSPIYRFFMIVLFPIIIIMEMIVKIFSRGKKVDTITGEEIESFITMGRLHGGLDDSQYEKMKSILEFEDTSVQEIMTPRVKLDALPDNVTVEKAMEYYLSHSHSRIPVYHETIDKIDYFVTARDLLREYNKGNKAKLLSEVPLRQVLKVPINQSISKLFEEFKTFRKVFAIIIDEYGGVAGLVSTEDIIEEVFGEIRDEFDKEAESLVKKGDNSYVVESDVLIEDVLDEFNLSLENIGLDEKEFDGENVSYVITHLVEGFPQKGEVIKLNVVSDQELFDGDSNNQVFEMKVLEIDDAKIGKVSMQLINQAV